MDVPGIVEETLAGEEVVERVPLGGEDELYVTDTRTLRYSSDGLLSDESVAEYPHDAERVVVSEGRRKARVTLHYPVDGSEDLSLPADRVDDALSPILTGILGTAGVLGPDESVVQTFRFSELTVMVATDRLVKHVGEAVWDEECEEFAYDAITGVEYEEGNVATQIVLEVDGRTERIKAPSERAPAVRRRLEEALRTYHDVDGDLNEALRPDESDDEESTVEEVDERTTGEEPTEGDEGLDDGAGLQETVRALGENEPSGEGQAATVGAADDAGESGGTTRTERDASGAERAVDTGSASDVGAVDQGSNAASDPADADGEFEAAGFEPADAGPDVAAELAELRAVVERQNELLAQQQRTIERLIERLNRGQ